MMLTLNNKKVIEYIVGMDAIMAIHTPDVHSLKYDFIKKEIILQNQRHETIGVYNLLERRLEHLQNFINNL